MEVFDNVLDLSHREIIKNHLIGSDFPWFYHPNTVKNISSNENIFDSAQFTHTFYRYVENKGLPNSSFTEITDNILRCFLNYQKIERCEILRCRANIQLQNKQRADFAYNNPHKDLSIPHMVLLYYVNDSDGDTFIFNNELDILNQVSPVEGRFLLFDGNYLHSGSHPKHNKHRCVINYNLRF
jgi:hypothetical protein